MKRARKYVLEEVKHRMTLEEPGKPLLFDVDRRLVAEVTSKHDFKALAQSLQGKEPKKAEAALERFGRKLMKLVIELADHKYPERTGEMIERVARQTGISFPHRFERYVEISLIGSRPQDRWNVVKATTKELVLQIYSCAAFQAIKEQGLEYQGLPCQALCFASFKVAAQQTGDRIKMELRKELPRDGMCEFSFSV